MTPEIFFIVLDNFRLLITQVDGAVFSIKLGSQFNFTFSFKIDGLGLWSKQDNILSFS